MTTKPAAKPSIKPAATRPDLKLALTRKTTPRSLHKRKLHTKKSTDTQGSSTILASAVGGRTLGSFFGVVGVIVGAAVGGSIGAFIKPSHA